MCVHITYGGESVYDFQKANMWKRISAALCDVILLAIVVTGIAVLLSAVLDMEGYDTRFKEIQTSYKEQHGIYTAEKYQQLSEEEKADSVIEKDYASLTEEERVRYDEAEKAFRADEEANYVYGMIINLIFIIVTFSILLGFLLMEFVVPLLFKNGQTVGKKVFGVAVMRKDGVKLSPMLLFTRTVLGKYAVETMVPVFIIIMIFLNVMGIVGTVVVIGLLIAQIILIASTKARTPLHDMLAQTVTVDFASQKIFDSPEALLEYKQRIHSEQVESEKN